MPADLRPEVCAALVAEAGTPLWLFDLDQVKANGRYLKSLVQTQGGLVSYAIKANDHPRVLAAVKDAGVLAEAASGREYELARKAGFEGSEIVFNGPLKPDDEILQATSEGALVNIDNREELQRALQIVPSGSRLGLRLKASVIAGTVPDRFGLSEDDLLAAARALRGRGIALHQLHVHLGSYTVANNEGPTSSRVELIWPRSPEMTSALTQELVRVARALHAQGTRPLTISIGGGLPSGPSAAEHLEAANRALREGGLAQTPLAVEPGRAVVANAGWLLTSVVSAEVEDGRQRVVVDAGTHLLPSAQWKDLPIGAVRDRGPRLLPTTVFGPLCLQSDVLAWDAMLPPLDRGALLRMESIGAYNLTRASAFIFPLAPLAWFTEGNWRVATEDVGLLADASVASSSGRR